MSLKQFRKRLADLQGRPLIYDDPDAPPDLFELGRRICFVLHQAERIDAGIASAPEHLTNEEFLGIAQRILDTLYPTTEMEPQ